MLGKKNAEEKAWKDAILLGTELDRLGIDPTSMFTHWVVVRAIVHSLSREERSLLNCSFSSRDSALVFILPVKKFT